MRKEHGGKDPITQLVMTNHPSHYTKDREIPQHARMLVQASLLPVKPARMEALMAITHATNLYGSIPQELPKSLPIQGFPHSTNPSICNTCAPPR
jgi:hypothetical protein